jgi:hypothetical protein
MSVHRFSKVFTRLLDCRLRARGGMPLLEVAAVVTEEGRGLLDFLGALNPDGAREFGIAPNAGEDGFRLLAFCDAALEELLRIAPPLTARPLGVFALDFNKPWRR